MPSIHGICALSFTFTIGFLMVILGVALPQYHRDEPMKNANAYPLFVLLTYVLAPIPTMLSRKASEDGAATGHPAGDVALFVTAALVCSGYGIPFVLWHANIIAAAAGWLVAAGNTVMFISIGVYFAYFTENDGYASF